MNCIGIETFGGTPVRVTFDDTISAVERGDPRPTDVYLSPGFIDLQVNGFLRRRFQRSRMHSGADRALHPGAVRHWCDALLSYRDHRLASRICWTRCATSGAPRKRWREGAAMDGFHVEGPHISPDDGPRGAHPRRWVRPPDLDEFRRWQEATGNQVRIVTLAPDWPEVAPLYRGHHRAKEWWPASATPTPPRSNSPMPSAPAPRSPRTWATARIAVMRRHPNYLWEQLAEDRLMADFIVDGIHLPPSFLKVALRAKTVGALGAGDRCRRAGRLSAGTLSVGRAGRSSSRRITA